MPRNRTPVRAKTRANTKSATWCKAFRNHELDGHVFVEISNTGRKVWAGRFQCLRCGTERIDFMVPDTCELISRRYFHPDDYPSDLDRETAKREVMRSLLDDAA